MIPNILVMPVPRSAREPRPEDKLQREFIQIIRGKRSDQSGFIFSINSTFHARRHFLMRFSRTMASWTSPYSSNQTSRWTHISW